MKTKYIVLAMFFFYCLAATVQAESYVLFRQYDRNVFYPYEEYTLLDTQTDGFQPTYKQRFILNLELKPFDHAFLPYILVRYDVKIRRGGDDSDEPGHFNPLAIDMGGGALWKFDNWVFTLFGSSEHFFNAEDHAQAYNYLELKYILPWGTTQ